MFRFIETIRIEDGCPINLNLHQKRMETTIKHFWPGMEFPQLEDILSVWKKSCDILKARIVYDCNGIVEKSATPYTMRNIRSLRIVQDDAIEYTYKSSDRSTLERLHDMRGESDEVLIVKDGLLTDTSYTNIALFDGIRWLTPRKPLLNGTMRQKLLAEGKVYEADITPCEINRFDKIALFNAMIDLGRLVLDTKCVKK